MSRATLRTVSERAIRRANVARIETFNRHQCVSALTINVALYLFSDGNSSVAEMQRTIIQAYDEGILSARDIERIHKEDSRG